MKLIIVTSISSPNPVLRALAEGAAANNDTFVVIGDRKSPADFQLEGARFLGIHDQATLGYRFAHSCPMNHYARKNIGYLIAISERAECIAETDDDNFPRADFFSRRSRQISTVVTDNPGWVNVYRYFCDANIWPRGLPLDRILDTLTPFELLPTKTLYCPIHQGLADENPDVDAIYRLTLPLPQNFRKDRELALGAGSWCPFNSQNTTWWPEVYPLLYLPAYCSFRMTDIWRSFVAQRIAWANGWHVLFHGPTVWQARNAHDLMRDFAEEVPGYLNNDRIRKTLEDLHIVSGSGALFDNLRACYRALVDLGVVGAQELPLLDCWIADFETLTGVATHV